MKCANEYSYNISAAASASSEKSILFYFIVIRNPTPVPTPTFMATTDLNRELGESYEAQGDWKLALNHYKVSARERNDATSNYKVGFCYFYGMNAVTIDWKIAIQHLEKAEVQGHAAAKSLLAYCYERGYGVTKSASKARELHLKEPRDWRSKLALIDDPLNTEDVWSPVTEPPLGEASNGLLFPLSTHLRWPFLSSNSTYVNALRLAKRVEQCEELIKTVEMEVVEGNIDAIVWLGEYRTNGLKTTGTLGMNIIEARELLNMASEQGHAHAQFLLALNYQQSGEPLGQPSHNAHLFRQWFLSSIAQGYPLAYVSAAMNYFYSGGCGLVKCPSRAMQMLEYAAEKHGHSSAKAHIKRIAERQQSSILE